MFIYNRAFGAGRADRTTMSDTNGNPSSREAYQAPESELFIIASERAIMSYTRDGDNEHTEEEELF